MVKNTLARCGPASRAQTSATAAMSPPRVLYALRLGQISLIFLWTYADVETCSFFSNTFAARYDTSYGSSLHEVVANVCACMDARGLQTILIVSLIPYGTIDPLR